MAAGRGDSTAPGVAREAPAPRSGCGARADAGGDGGVPAGAVGVLGDAVAAGAAAGPLAGTGATGSAAGRAGAGDVYGESLSERVEAIA